MIGSVFLHQRCTSVGWARSDDGMPRPSRVSHTFYAFWPVARLARLVAGQSRHSLALQYAKMPPSTSAGGIARYTALPPPKQQKAFPERRRSVKPKRAIPKLQKEQSTLTQIDFVSTPKMSTEVTTISDSDVSDFEEPRPKKRRRTKFGEKERGQATLTQFDRDSAQRLRRFELDEDGFQIWEDGDPERSMTDVRARQDGRKRKLPWLRQEDDDAEDLAQPPEIPETSQHEPVPSLKHSDIEDEVPAKQTQFETPRRVRCREVPSSQTPPSTTLSRQSLVQKEEAQRSPLKERSWNVQAAMPQDMSPEPQHVTMKMLERVRLATRKVPLNDTTPSAKASEFPLSSQVASSETKQVPVEPRARPLQRAATIRDSQSEDFDLSNTTTITASPTRPTRTLKRVTTVQDSQYDDADLSSDNETATYQPSHASDDEEQLIECCEGDDEEATFDPANSALDRDAGRFGWTQTQQPYLSDIEENADADSETEDEDLDRGFPPPLAAGPVILSSDEPSQGQGEPSSPPALQRIEDRGGVKTGAPVKRLLELQRPDSRDDSAYESGAADLLPRHGEVIEVPSSPPPLRPFQVNTVRPTQSSLALPQSRELQKAPTSENPCTAHPLTISSSPQKSVELPSLPLSTTQQESFRDILSSSPLPLPPWSESGHCREARSGWTANKGGSQLKSLVDFSLPPPPPMSSTGRSTPLSSSM